MSCKPFTYDEYRFILRELKERYSVVGYEQALDLVNSKTFDPFVIIRHDVDVSIQKAAKLAMIDHALDVQSTFFILPASPIYNFTEYSKILKTFQSLGHSLAIHFDPGLSYDGKSLNQTLKGYATLFSALFSKVDCFNLHCPHKLSKALELNHPRLINAFEEPFFTTIKYFGDGWGQWRYGHPLESEEFKQGKPLHLNFHPIWWNEEPKSPLVCLNEFAKNKDEELKWHLAQNLMGF